MEKEAIDKTAIVARMRRNSCPNDSGNALALVMTRYSRFPLVHNDHIWFSNDEMSCPLDSWHALAPVMTRYSRFSLIQNDHIWKIEWMGNTNSLGLTTLVSSKSPSCALPRVANGNASTPILCVSCNGFVWVMWRFYRDRSHKTCCRTIGISWYTTQPWRLADSCALAATTIRIVRNGRHTMCVYVLLCTVPGK